MERQLGGFREPSLEQTDRLEGKEQIPGAGFFSGNFVNAPLKIEDE
jgi:hypothetical protein